MSDEIKAVVLTVGGSPEPLIKSLTVFQPEVVVFMVSQETADQVPDIKKTLNQSGCRSFKDHKIMIDDIKDATHCYQKSLQAFEYIEKSGIKIEQTLADITGGTKIMSAALLLAAGARECKLNYTSGKQRNQDGIGTVITGSEELFRQVTPWQVLALEERRNAARMFNSFQFEAAASLFESAGEKASQAALKRYLIALNNISKAYRDWDKFDHENALHLLQKGYNELTVYADCSGDNSAGNMAAEISENLRFLGSFSKMSSKSGNVSINHIKDLLANARRRSLEGKYDDAVARLYRTLEMLAQERLKTKYGLDAGKIPLENEFTVKALISLGPQFKEKHIRSDIPALQLSLFADYQFLNALEDDLAGEYFEHETEIRKILDTRNNSILAHGTRVLGKNDFERLWKLILEFSSIQENSLPAFPLIPIPTS